MVVVPTHSVIALMELTGRMMLAADQCHLGGCGSKWY